MKRLTKKLEKPFETKYLHYDYMRIGDYDISKGNYGRITDAEIYNKLGQLEDIEDELGIELTTLFKALTDSIAVKNEDGSITVLWACPRFQISLCTKDSWILYGPVDEQKVLNIKDYGKTWALTEEELL